MILLILRDLWVDHLHSRKPSSSKLIDGHRAQSHDLHDFSCCALCSGVVDEHNCDMVLARGGKIVRVRKAMQRMA